MPVLNGRRALLSGGKVSGFTVSSLGWDVNLATPPGTLLPMQTVQFLRAGYTTSATPTYYAENIVITSRVRLPWPNISVLNGGRCALSDFVYSTDLPIGGANNSALTSPQPVAQWVTVDRQVVGNSLTVDLVAFHRNGRNGSPVACVTGTATDGTNTATASTSTPIVLGDANDLNAVIGYRLTFSLSSLSNNALITVNAKVYPWIGGSGSILDSSATGVAVDGRGFGPRVYYRSTSLASSPPYAYVNATTGNDSTGVVSTTATTASASPFLTLQAAINKLRTTYTYTTGCIIRIQASGGTLALGSTSVTSVQNENGGELIIQSDPAGGTATISYGTAFNTYNPYVRWQNLNITRTANVFFPYGAYSGTNAKWTFQNVTYNGGGYSAVLTGANMALNLIGVSFTNASANILNTASATLGLLMVRGCSTSITMPTVEAFNMVGCTFANGMIRSSGSTRSPAGTVIAFNKFMNLSGTSVAFGFGTSNEVTALGGTNPMTITGIAVVQNIFEKADTSNAASFRPSGDSDQFTLVHLVVWNNTFTGIFGGGGLGRMNCLYDDQTNTTVRYHTLHSFRGNIHSQINTKSDVFVSTNGNGSPDPTDGPSHIGNWPFKFGVGCYGEFAQWVGDDGYPWALGSSFSQDYPGLLNNLGQSETVRNDPLFIAYAGTTSTGTTPVAGTGNGTYTLNSGSPCIGVIPSSAFEALPYDLAGTARTRGAIGAYA